MDNLELVLHKEGKLDYIDNSNIKLFLSKNVLEIFFPKKLSRFFH